MEQVKNLLEFVKICSGTFERNEVVLGQGTDTYWDEAVYLAILALNLPPDISESEGERVLSTDELNLLEKLMNARIKERKPISYLTGISWYRGRKFIVNKNVIIPRSPIGEIIDNDFFGLLENLNDPLLLDLCTGGGALAILMAQVCPLAKVDAVDISEPALVVAKQNIIQHNVVDRVNLIQSDLFNEISTEKKYDLIISNPPYVGDLEYDQLLPEFKHEPKNALVCENNGLYIPLQILKHAKKYLNEMGGLILEVGYSEDDFEKVTENYSKEWIELTEGGSGVVYIPYESL